MLQMKSKSKKDKDLLAVPVSLYERVIRLHHDNMNQCSIENSIEACRR